MTLAEAARFWARLGMVSFGGPAAQIALLFDELVGRRRWLSERRFLHALQVCLLLPGPEATQLAIYLGWLMHGVGGGLIAGGLFLLPSVLLLLTLSSVYALWGHLPLLASVFWALKPAVIALVLQATWLVAKRTLRHPFQGLLALVAFAGLVLLKWPYPWLLALAAGSGILVGRFRPGWLNDTGHRNVGKAGGTLVNSAPNAYLHGDDTPPPAHARPSSRRLGLALLATGIALGVPLLLLIWLQGWSGLLATMARFFTQVALFSFGGAYAVLPYVSQGAVTHFGWLQPAQMLDGLALGETTPGPLIMVVAFVGFMGGWNASGALGLAWLAGLVVVWFTFLPSFAFILIGAPFVEASRDKPRLLAPLAAITAMLTGVIASLAVVLAGPVLWPRGLAGGVDWLALLLVALALVLLLVARWRVLSVIGAAAMVGVGRWLWLGL
ncbi:MAG: chromate efflux transporter [Cyanobacteria bacterium]|nr:chromate efflux transporter [Cyanobacteriota bacterium]